MASIFYEADLQSGIILALRDSKSVACFIRNDGEESSKWEDEYLRDAQVIAALTDRAITLRIQAGSQEAGFLAAYYPIPAVPALIIIHNGLLTLDLRSGQDKAAFKAGILTTLIAKSSTSSMPSTTPEAAVASMIPPSSQEQPATTSQNPHPASPPSSSSQQPTLESSPSDSPTAIRSHIAQEDALTNPTSSSSSQQSVVQRLLEERRRKLEVDKKQKEAAEKADRKARAEKRQESITAAPDLAMAKQATYAQQQRKRNAEAKLERDRILRQIEQDKVDRKEKEERRKALAKAEARAETQEDSKVPDTNGNGNGLPLAKNANQPELAKSKDCAVQVRLFDGSTIRSKFKIEQTLTDVREWVDNERSDDVPFTFKQILSPLPNRTLTISEEKDSLMQLDFVPSATLVMVPIKGYTAAYMDSSQGIISKVVSIPYNTVAAGAGLVSGALGTFLGFGQAVQQQGESSTQAFVPTRSVPQSGSTGSGINVRTLGDQREERDVHQLYNGNQINIEPRNDNRDKED